MAGQFTIDAPVRQALMSSARREALRGSTPAPQGSSLAVRGPSTPPALRRAAMRDRVVLRVLELPEPVPDSQPGLASRRVPAALADLRAPAAHRQPMKHRVHSALPQGAVEDVRNIPRPRKAR